MKRLKIGITVNGNLEKPQGATVRAESIFQTLKEEHDTTLIFRGKRDFRQDNKIMLRALRKGAWNLKLLTLLFRKKFDALYCSGDIWGFLSCYLMAKFMGHKVIYEVQGILSEEEKLRNPPSPRRIKIKQTLERFVTSHADHVVTVSQDMLDFYAQYTRRISLIHLLADELFMNKGDSHTKHGPHKDYKQVAFIGPFYPGQNAYSIEFLYDNLERFDERIRFVVFGRCDYRIKSDRIRYTGHIESFEDYAEELSSMDMVWCCELASVGPYTKVVEAMACGVPVVATPQTRQGMEWVRNGEDIILCEPEEMMAVINRSLFDEELMQRISHNARAGIKKYHSREVVAEKLEGVLTGLVSDLDNDEH